MLELLTILTQNMNTSAENVSLLVRLREYLLSDKHIRSRTLELFKALHHMLSEQQRTEMSEWAAQQLLHNTFNQELITILCIYNPREKITVLENYFKIVSLSTSVQHKYSWWRAFVGQSELYSQPATVISQLFRAIEDKHAFISIILDIGLADRSPIISSIFMHLRPFLILNTDLFNLTLNTMVFICNKNEYQLIRDTASRIVLQWANTLLEESPDITADKQVQEYFSFINQKIQQQMMEESPSWELRLLELSVKQLSTLWNLPASFIPSCSIR